MRKLLLAAALSLMGCQAIKLDVKPDAPRPPVSQVNVDFTGVFDGKPTSHSVPVSRDKSFLRRVLLSPNVVFESSRSSVPEPGVEGPANAGPDTPNLDKALGLPVATRLSSVLLSELARRGAVLLTPAETRLHADICDKNCNMGTWVERMLVRYQRASAVAKTEDQLNDLPTSLFAVRELAFGWRSAEVIAIRNANGDLVFQPKRRPGETSFCDVAKVDVPVVKFSAELLSIRDGRLLVRIDETLGLKFEARRRVDAATLSPVKATAYKKMVGQVPQDKYEYVERWETRQTDCANALAELRRVGELAIQSADPEALAREVITIGINRISE